MPRPSDTKRRDRLLLAAERLFGHYGTAKTTVADIARAADTSVGSVYNEFDSKRALLGALSARHLTRVLDLMRDAARHEADAQAGLRAMLHARLGAFLDLRDCAAHGDELVGRRCPATRAAYTAFIDAEQSLLKTQVVAITPSGTAAQAFAVQTATAAFAPPLCFEGRPDVLRARLDTVVTVLLVGLRPRGTVL